jgi:hypothetical protein
MIRFTCFCGKRFKAKPELAGRRARCPVCLIEFTIPQPPLTAEPLTGDFPPYSDDTHLTSPPDRSEPQPQG